MSPRDDLGPGDEQALLCHACGEECDGCSACCGSGVTGLEYEGEEPPPDCRACGGSGCAVAQRETAEHDAAMREKPIDWAAWVAAVDRDGQPTLWPWETP